MYWPIFSYIRKCVMCEHMLHTNMKCVLSNLWYVRNFLCPNLCFIRNYDVFVQNAVAYDNVICSNLCHPRKYDLFCPNLRYIINCLSKLWCFCPKCCCIRQCNIFEPMSAPKIWCILSKLKLHMKLYHMIHTNMRCILSELISQTKRCNVRVHDTHENMMSHARTEVTYKMCNVRTYVTHEYEIIFCPNWCYIRNCGMSEYMLHTNMRCFLSEHMLDTKLYYVQNYVIHENMVSGVRTYVTYENV